MSDKTLSSMKDEPQTNTIYYGVYTPNDNKDYNTTPNVFEDKIEALKVAKKNKKSRFKAFHFYHEAVEFALNGSEFPNNNASLNTSSNNKTTDSANNVGEKSSPFKGPKPQELVELRKHIENGYFKVVKDTIWQNPRYLVSSGDTPAILQEGPRYNALHVAAKSKNAEITELILNTISNPEFVKLLNGDDNQLNAEYRTAVLLDLYLNTPNKGLNETPLHFASKHGAVEVVEILVSYPQCDKTLKNKFQKTAAQIICERADGENVSAVKKAIETLLQESYYVPVLRAEDECMPPLIGEPFSPSSPPMINSDPLSPRLEIHAYAGPMDKKEAQHFRKVWKTPPRSLNCSLPGSKSKEFNIVSLKYRDPKKGLERIGKRLANTYKVSWKEYWPFLDSFIDLSSEEGLNSLETYLTDRNTLLNISLFEEAKKSSDLNVSDSLSPISNLCQAFSSCHINDSTRSHNSSDDHINDKDSINYIDKSCRVFANRISNDILYILCSEDNILQILETEIKQLELLMTSYMDDTRFSMINFQKIHSRLGILVGQKLYNNLKENVRVFLSEKLSTMLDSLTKSIDCFSSDDESHNLDISETRKPTIYKRQLICLLHFILNVLTQNFDCKQGTEDAGCVKDWDKAEPCTCVYHSRKSKRNNSLSRSNSFKNGSKLFQTSSFDSIPRRLSFSETDGNPDCVLNGFNVSNLKNSTESNSDDESEDKFYTPPSSPSFLNSDSESEDEFMDSQLPKHEVFLEGENPTKLDCEVFNALCYSEVKLDNKKYPNIYKWYHTISLYSQEERDSWISEKDQEKAKKFFPNTSVNITFNMDSPRTSTPSKSWFRITGANSPKSALKSRSLLF
ncbi:ankyrin repeat and LEM domain-containing protein 2 homolog isoform X1 [Diorhabda sublineata]|uniref:ankyrin repeat and LEM domain-containing protein 2 homolog isoform X1 n=1 Tax=Diorhabda sublineata TaxID=1163346 RepID=UPI0024E14EC8|nr:ankyrin repeat and LEM domain-containing protein 2 homolog isoform X1 [Diorhabda sublineata]